MTRKEVLHIPPRPPVFFGFVRRELALSSFMDGKVLGVLPNAPFRILVLGSLPTSCMLLKLVGRLSLFNDTGPDPHTAKASKNVDLPFARICINRCTGRHETETIVRKSDNTLTRQPNTISPLQPKGRNPTPNRLCLNLRDISLLHHLNQRGLLFYIQRRCCGLVCCGVLVLEICRKRL